MVLTLLICYFRDRKKGLSNRKPITLTVGSGPLVIKLADAHYDNKLEGL